VIECVRRRTDENEIAIATTDQTYQIQHQILAAYLNIDGKNIDEVEEGLLSLVPQEV
jgi:hypothetical protein